MTSLRTIAAAKLNLTLEILGKREDGFHDLSSVAISLDLADDVRLTPDDVLLTPGGDGRTIAYLDADGHPFSIQTNDDIIARAWSALEAHCDLQMSGRVDVVKRIPVTSGLGGGSTNAAAFLRLANEAWTLGLSDDDLSRIGSQVGSDVAACVIGGPVMMAGRGERVESIEAPSASLGGWAVLLYRPEIPVPEDKTATMYRSLRSSDFRDGAYSSALEERLLAGRSPTQDDCINSFDASAREVMQGLTPAWRRMGAAIARAAVDTSARPVTPLLAGAGPTMFAILAPETAHAAATELQGAPGLTRVVLPIARAEATIVCTD